MSVKIDLYMSLLLNYRCWYFDNFINSLNNNVPEFNFELFLNYQGIRTFSSNFRTPS